MKVLVIGGGGREHALAWKAAGSPGVERVFVAPGNAGTARERGCENVAVAADDIDGLVRLARERAVDLTIVGPEAPLVAGVVDAFEAAGLAVFGPRAQCARIEGSKAFAKAFMARHRIPTAAWGTFDDADAACAWIDAREYPVVVKADGLAAGKGVVVADSAAEARDAARAMLADDAFGEAGRRVVIEERLLGEEASFICMVAGERVLALASSQDHKARDDGDRGPNTGGMGAYSPAPVVDSEVHRRALEEVMLPAARGMVRDGTPYIGFLYAGLMIGSDGAPRVLEFNCRFGDPEAQPVMMRLRSDLVGLCRDALAGRLPEHAEWDPRPALAVVLAAEGYPGPCRGGDRIDGLDTIAESGTLKVFHAGTRLDDGYVVTAGGRVLAVSALADSVADARRRAYEAVERIQWPGAFCRRDIAHRALAREGAGSDRPPS
jgi:phosphoribosylamine---glycine ligase